MKNYIFLGAPGKVFETGKIYELNAFICNSVIYVKYNSEIYPYSSLESFLTDWEMEK